MVECSDFVGYFLVGFPFFRQSLFDNGKNPFSLLSLPWNFWEQLQRFVIDNYRWLAVGLIVVLAWLAGRAMSMSKGRRGSK